MIMIIRRCVPDCGPLWKKIFIFLMAVAWFSGTASLLRGEEPEELRVALLVSRNIRPYLEAVEGITRILKEYAGADVTVFELEKMEGKGETVLKENLARKHFHLLIGVGPEAARLMADLTSVVVPMMYTMVLHPERTVSPSDCGIPLDIPLHIQLRKIAAALPSVRRLGLLYDPAFNADFLKKAVKHAPAHNLEIVPLPVSSRSDIPEVLDRNWSRIDGLWLIPDQTVISESIVQYVIKQALYKRRPAVGYNRFFYESGAALSFIFEYEEIGRQTGVLALDLMADGICESKPPVFHAWLNQRVLDRLGIPVPELAEVEAGP